MRACLRLLAALTIVVVGATLLQLSGFTERAELQQSGGVIEPDVLDALQKDSEAVVLISLVPPAAPLDEVSLTEMQQNTAQRQASVLSVLTVYDFTAIYQYSVVPALAGRITTAGVEKLAAHSDVLSVALDRVHTAALAESVPLIHADDGDLLSLGLDGTGVTVAVFDSGIDTDHPDLIDSIIGGKCFLDSNASDCPSGQYPYEDDWVGVYHGTRVSGVITSDGDNNYASAGVAPNAGIFAYKIIGGSTERWSENDMLAALDDIINPATFPQQEDIDYINMSLQSIETYLPGDCPVKPAIDAALEWLYLFGTVTFGISGNLADKLAITYPGCHDFVVSVGAVTDRPYDTFNWGPCTDSATAPDEVICFSDSSQDLALLAPGFDILTTSADEDLVERSAGTSVVAPHAVGVAALLKQAQPGLSPPQIIDRMKSTGKWVYDDLAERWTPRVDARVALLTDDNEDYDEDGCENGFEFGPDPTLGGQRNPLDPWDWYDVNQDGVIDLLNDILGVISHYAPDGLPPYNANWDRGPKTGPNPWNMTAPDGVIDLLNDVLGVIVQYNPEGCRNS